MKNREFKVFESNSFIITREVCNKKHFCFNLYTMGQYVRSYFTDDIANVLKLI